MNIVEYIRKNEKVTVPFYGLTRNKHHKEYLGFFKRSSLWSQEQIQNWQFQKLWEIVDYAYRHVPFYHSLYKSIGFEPGDLKSLKDFEALPCISKEMIKENEQLLCSDQSANMEYRVDFTGGSTGQPMRFLIDDELYQREDAAYRFYWKTTGFSDGEKCIVLRGKKICSQDNKKIYEYNRFWNYMYLDSFYITPDYFQMYRDAIQSFNARFIQAYPSSLCLLARLYSMAQKEAPKFQNIYLSSENVYPEQIEMIERVFRPDHIYNQYGHSEKVLLGLQMLDGKALGIMPQYGFLELIDEGGAVIRKESELGEIVGTSFSKVFPFIRYKTGDMTSYSMEKTEDYMRYWQKINYIEGRLHEFIHTKDKRKVSICTVGGAHIKELNSVLDMQYEQFKEGELILNVVENPRQTLSEEDKKTIQRKYEDLFEKQIQCQIKTVSTIERTGRGKKVMLVQHIV